MVDLITADTFGMLCSIDDGDWESQRRKRTCEATFRVRTRY